MLTLIDLNYSRQVAPLISDELFEEMKKIIADKKQVLLYLNRRGEATSLYCRDCGNILKCEFCDVSLTIHRYPEKHLLCHLCNTAGPVPHNCSKCNGTNLVPVGVGVQKIEEGLEKLFPEEIILRLDSDKKRHETITEKDIENARIIIATELGNTLFPTHLGLVVFCLFEANLTTPEYDMEERVYDQIAYNLRKNVPLIIQTFSPNTPLLKIIEGGNYKDFLTHTLTERKLFHYPPYTGLAYIWVEDKNKNRVQEIIHKLVNKLTLIKNENIILNYDKELYERRAGDYRQKIVLRGASLEELLEQIKGEIFKNRGVRLEWK